MKFFTFEVCKQGNIQSFGPIKGLTAFVSMRSLNNIYQFVHFGKQHYGFILFIVHLHTRYPQLTSPEHYLLSVLCILLIFAFAYYLGQESRGYKFTG